MAATITRNRCRRGIGATAVAGGNGLRSVIRASPTAGAAVIIRVVHIAANDEVVEECVVGRSGRSVFVEQLHFRNRATVGAGETRHRAPARLNTQSIGGGGIQNKLHPQTGAEETNAGIALGAIIVFVIALTTEEIELQHIAAAGGLQAEAHFLTGIYPTVIHVNAHHLAGGQRGEGARSAFRRTAAVDAQGVAAGAIDVEGRRETATGAPAIFIAGRGAAVDTTATARGPRITPASANLRP